MKRSEEYVVKSNPVGKRMTITLDRKKQHAAVCNPDIPKLMSCAHDYCNIMRTQQPGKLSHIVSPAMIESNPPVSVMRVNCCVNIRIICSYGDSEKMTLKVQLLIPETKDKRLRLEDFSRLSVISAKNTSHSCHPRTNAIIPGADTGIVVAS